jgi:NAD(P)H dehydrogenase (quinone)
MTARPVIAVAAASGRLGRSTLRALSAHWPGSNPVAIVRTPSKLEALPGVVVRQGDYASLDSMTAALQGVQSLVLISAPALAGSDRVQLHRNAIEAARRAGVRKVVYTSVIGNGAEMQTGFAATQRVNRQTETDLAESGLDWIVARNGLYLDIDIQLMKAAAAADGVYESSAAEGRCCYISVDELAHATAALVAGDRPSRRIYNLVGETITVPVLTQLVAGVYGLRVECRSITDEQALGKLRAEPRIRARGGEEVAQMLSGAQHAERLGAFDVVSDFEAAAGRPCPSIRDMVLALQRAESGG